ncbi:MAG: nucleotidyltransferase domain-containing protein [Endomicrobium sp.]|jgi:predicted nucleotidyltransferase|nr:nucleotidyltransferase domain-containing protein [Endomicrobium sp.]
MIKPDYGLSERTLTTLNNIFKKYSGLEKVILYGSRAKGDYKSGSDIDITLETDTTFTYQDLTRIYGDFDNSDIPYSVDVSLYKNLDSQALKEHIKRVGKAIYKKDNK